MKKNPKIIMLGDMNVGKTAILQTLITKRFPEKLANTLGACYQQYTLYLSNNKSITLDIWDTAGQQKYRSLLSMYYKSCDGIVLVFDVTKLQSLKTMDYWASQIELHCSSNPVIYLVGNKIDLKQTTKIIPNDTVRSYYEKYGWKFLYCSAKQSYNIDQLFQRIGGEAERRSISSRHSQRIQKSSKKKKKENDSCC